MVDWPTIGKVSAIVAGLVALVCILATQRGRDAFAMLALRVLDVAIAWLEKRLSDDKLTQRYQRF